MERQMQIHEFNLKFINRDIALLEQHIKQLRNERANEEKYSYVYIKPRLS